LKYLKLNVSDSHSERFNNAILLYKGGDLTGAEKIFRDLVNKGRGFKRDFDHSSQREYWMGMIRLEKGETEKAVDMFRKALKGSPGSPFALSYLYALTGEEIYEKKIGRYFDRIDAYYFIGRAFLKIRMFHSAVKYLSYVHETIPEYRKGNICYAVALAESGDNVSAYNILVESMKKRREPLMFEKEVIDVFRDRTMKQPDNGVAHFYLGQIYEQYGNFSDGLKHYLESRKLLGDRKIISSRIIEIKKKMIKRHGEGSEVILRN
ncbi:MAG: tetratricopeptide repeat protein, partial [Candidatus Aminicenantes bacterium]|nr:tetratricopeptide repeat protein [Candidatus Aminicenantes bacterium]